MLKVDEIQNGVVIDHITAGTGLALYHMMELEKLTNASVALLQNVRSQKDGKKDIQEKLLKELPASTTST